MLGWPWHGTLSTILLPALLVSATTQPREASGQIVLVVHPDNATNDITLQNLRLFYLGRITILPDGRRAILAEYAPIREMFYQSVTDMTTDEIRRRWLRLVFSGASGRPPTEFIDTDELKRFVARTRGALAFMPSSEVDDRVKVLTVDGRQPGDPDYPLREPG